MDELFRRFWLPAMLPEALSSADCPPVRLRLLGEDLVAFRDSNNKIGVVEAHCPHRGASLCFGRNEECGIRCVYHGWKVDVDGLSYACRRKCVWRNKRAAHTRVLRKTKAESRRTQILAERLYLAGVSTNKVDHGFHRAHGLRIVRRRHHAVLRQPIEGVHLDRPATLAVGRNKALLHR